jgi:1-acyl-sn-glycerol-3-phosphate acyltransferase
MRLTYALSAFWIRALIRIVFGLRIKGLDRIPKRSQAIIAVNHQSYLDPPVVGACLGREAHFLAMEPLFRHPILGPLVRYFNAMPVGSVRLDLGAFRKVVEILQQGGAVVVFPEGGRSQTGDLQKGESGVGFLAAQTGVDVYPVYIKNTRLTWRRLRVRRPIEVIFGEPIRYQASGQGPKRQAYRAFSQQVMEKIAALKAANL